MASPRSADRPPGPAGLPLVGNVRGAGDLLAFLTENARTYGDVVYFEVAGKPYYQLNHPDDVEAVLVGERFSKGRLNQAVLDPVVGEGLFTSEGQTWRTGRRRIEPAFHPDRIGAYGDVMVACTAGLVADWSPGDRVDVHAEMERLALEILARTLLGTDLRRDVDAIGRYLDVVLGYVDSPPNLLLPDWAPRPGSAGSGGPSPGSRPSTSAPSTNAVGSRAATTWCPGCSPTGDAASRRRPDGSATR